MEQPSEWITQLKDVSDLQHLGFHQFDKAHTVMLAEEGLIPKEDAKKIFQSFREMETDGAVETRKESGHQGHAGEAYLIENLGEEVGGQIHLGRSSNDLSPVSKRFMMRMKLLDTMDACIDLMEAYCDVAEKHKNDVMPTYTAFKHAQIGTFGWYVMSWERPIERAFDRLVEVYPRVNQSPAGSAAETTTDFAIDRKRTAELLGFDEVMDNGKDATRTDYDVYLEAINAIALPLVSIAEAADRILLWSMTEIDRVDIPDTYVRTSSIMPQKRNPSSIQSIQSAIDGTVGDLMQSFMQARGVLGKPSVSESTFENAILHVQHWAELVENIEFDREKAREQIYLDWAFATDLAGLLVREEGLPWRSAHQVVSILVRKSEESGKDVRDITVDDINEAAQDYLGTTFDLQEDQVKEIINPERAIRSRGVNSGSPAPREVEEQVQQSRSQIDQANETVARLRERLSESEDELERAIDEIIQ